MSENIETPEGWERRGKFLFRQYGESFATIWWDGDGDWASTVATLGESAASESWDGTLEAAVAWANEQLGVLKPVEVVEREFADGSVLMWSEDGARSVRVYDCLGTWTVDSILGGLRCFTKTEAMNHAREYVGGAS